MQGKEKPGGKFEVSCTTLTLKTLEATLKVASNGLPAKLALQIHQTFSLLTNLLLIIVLSNTHIHSVEKF